MHWMKDWASPFPIFAEDGEGASLIDVDERAYDDFCLGDTPGMFGHANPFIVSALSEQARKGATFMLPTEEAAEVGELAGGAVWFAVLADHFVCFRCEPGT